MLPVRGTHGAERGEMGIGILLAVTLTLVVAVGIVNIFMFLYGQSVVRSALDEGVRAGSRVDAGWVVCQDRAEQVLEDLLGGELGDGVTLICGPGASPDELVAIADATFDSPMPLVPSWTFHLEARATQELAATP